MTRPWNRPTARSPACSRRGRRGGGEASTAAPDTSATTLWSDSKRVETSERRRRPPQPHDLADRAGTSFNSVQSRCASDTRRDQKTETRWHQRGGTGAGPAPRSSTCTIHAFRGTTAQREGSRSNGKSGPRTGDRDRDRDCSDYRNGTTPATASTRGTAATTHALQVEEPRRAWRLPRDRQQQCDTPAPLNGPPPTGFRPPPATTGSRQSGSGP